MQTMLLPAALLLPALLLPALWLQAQEPPEKKAVPPWAQVSLGGEVRDLLALRSKVNVLALLDRDLKKNSPEYRWDGPPPQRVNEQAKVAHVRSMQVGDHAWVVVLLDATDKNLDALLPALKASAKGAVPVAFAGIIAAAKDKEPFVAYAQAWGQMYVPNPNEEKQRPGMGEVAVEGRILRGKFEWNKGKITPLAIENGTSPILVTGQALRQANEIRGKCNVRGRLLVQPGEPLVIEASAIAPR